MAVTTFSGQVKTLSGFSSDEPAVATCVHISHSQAENGDMGPLTLGSTDQYGRVAPSEVTYSNVSSSDDKNSVESGVNITDFSLELKPGRGLVTLRCHRSALYRFDFRWGYVHLPTPDTGLTLEWFDEVEEVTGIGLWQHRGLTMHNGVQNVSRYFGGRPQIRPPGPVVRKCEKGEGWNLWTDVHGLELNTTMTYAVDASWNYFMDIERLRNSSWDAVA